MLCLKQPFFFFFFFVVSPFSKTRSGSNNFFRLHRLDAALELIMTVELALGHL